MKVLLINPPTGKYMRDERCQVPVESRVAEPPRPPMDLAYMAAVLERTNVACMIRDYPMEKKTRFNLEDDIKNFEPNFLVISTTTPTIYNDLIACKLTKEINSDIITVAKGAHFLLFDKDILNRFEYLDLVIRGEPEETLEAIVKQAELRTIKGITFRDNGSIVRNEDRPLLEDLDPLPFPARHLLNNYLYRTPDTNEPIAFIYTSRGCPANCIFCAAGLVSGYKLRTRSVANVIGEIEECVTRYNIRNFFFRADTFTWDKDWVINLCRAIIDKKIKIRWGTNSRVDTIDVQRLQWMKKAGCYVIGFGAESGCQEILDKMGKNITLEQIEEAVNLCREFNMESFLHFVIGLPWDTEEAILETINYIKKIEPSFIEVNIAYPIPGTELYKLCLKDKLFVTDITGHNHILPATRTYSLSNSRLIELRKQILRSFYLRPKYLFKSLLRLNSPKIAWNYYKSAKKLFVNTLR